jgi:lipopolysaccharide biosynthesis regulator YciM
MKLTKAVIIFCSIFCLQIHRGYAAKAAPTHTVRGVVITTDGTVVPEFTVAVKHVSLKPELSTRKRYKNGEFTVSGLKGDKYQLQITSPLYISSRVEFDFKSDPRSTEYSIVILHAYRNEPRFMPGAAYTVSLKTLQTKIPDAARDAYMKGVELHRDGHLEEALMQYGRALRTYPDYVPALGDLGTIFILFNRPESALTFLRRAHEIDDRNVVINMDIAIALTEQADYANAMKLFKKVLGTTPRLALAEYYVAKIDYLQKKFEDAEVYARQAVQDDPRFLEGSLLLINISMQQKKYGQARDALVQIRQAMDNKTISAFIDEQLSGFGG